MAIFTFISLVSKIISIKLGLITSASLFLYCIQHLFDSWGLSLSVLLIVLHSQLIALMRNLKAQKENIQVKDEVSIELENKEVKSKEIWN